MGYFHARFDSDIVVVGWGAIVNANINAAKTHCKRGHPFDETNTYWRRGGGRVCKTCQRRTNYEWRERNRAEFNRKERERRHQLPREGKRRQPKLTYEYRMQHDGFPRRLLETLWLEGGWWTDEGLALRLDTDRDHVSRTFYRLHRAGLLESRRVGLGSGRNRIGMESRLEWKALSEPCQLALDFTD